MTATNSQALCVRHTELINRQNSKSFFLDFVGTFSQLCMHLAVGLALAAGCHFSYSFLMLVYCWQPANCKTLFINKLPKIHEIKYQGFLVLVACSCYNEKKTILMIATPLPPALNAHRGIKLNLKKKTTVK